MKNQAELNIAAGIMNVHDLSAYLRLSEAKVYRLARSGCIPAFRIGNSWRFKKTMIDEWIRHETELISVWPYMTLPTERSLQLETA
ncbi:MAG: helix-turn-helix domain-containing protein [Anaerolineales bacterium]|nr:helix-turn-helix domain-containing protein [Anaerolineales bacterium]